MRIIGLFLLAILIGSLTIAAAQAVRDDRPSVVGSWKLIAYEDTDNKGRTTFPWGEHPVGLLIYDDTGHMSVQIGRRPAPAASTSDPLKLARRDKALYFDSYIAYFGTYTIDPKRMTITHVVESDLVAQLIGISTEKEFEVTADRFILKPTWYQNSHKMTGVRIFERLPKITQK
jgi:Lipocalin-like domain